MIVEDEPAIRFALKYEFGEGDYQLITAEDAAKAFSIIDSNKPDLIILDIMLPGGRDEGFRMCRRLKSEAATRDIPIIILTARPAQDKIMAKDAGADRYFTKPPNMTGLRDAIHELLEIRENLS